MTHNIQMSEFPKNFWAGIWQSGVNLKGYFRNIESETVWKAAVAAEHACSHFHVTWFMSLVTATQ